MNSIFDGLKNDFLEALADAGEWAKGKQPSAPVSPLDMQTMTPRMFSTLVQAANKEGAAEFLARAVQRLARTNKRVDVLFGEAAELVRQAGDKIDKGNALVVNINELVATLQTLDPGVYTEMALRDEASLEALIPERTPEEPPQDDTL